MERAELSGVVRTEIALVFGVPVDEVTESTDLRAEYDADSLELMETGARLERALGTRLSADDLIGMQNVGHAIDLLYQRVRGPA